MPEADSRERAADFHGPEVVLVYLRAARSRVLVVVLVCSLAPHLRGPEAALVYLRAVRLRELAAALQFYLRAVQAQALRSPSSDTQWG